MPEHITSLTNNVLKLIEFTQHYQGRMSSVNLCNLHYLRTTNDFLDKVISLDIFDSISQSNYWYNISNTSTNPDVLLGMVYKVQEEAKETKLLLRQAALQSASDFSKMPDYQYRLKIHLRGLRSLLSILYHELCDWYCLPLFNLPINLIENQR